MPASLEKALAIIDKVTVDQVRSVYRGKRGCCCGCNGIHRWNSQFPFEDGYSIINNSYVKKILKFVKNEAKNAHEIYLINDIISITVDEGKNEMYYILYLAEGMNVGNIKLEINRQGEWIDFWEEREKEHQRLQENLELAEKHLQEAEKRLGLE